MNNHISKGLGALVLTSFLLAACAGATAVPTGTTAPVSTETSSVASTDTPAAVATEAVTSTTESSATTEATSAVVTGTEVAAATSTSSESATSVVTATSEATSTGVSATSEATATEVTPGALITTGTPSSGTPEAMPGTVIDAATANATLSTLMRALTASGLVDQLKQQGPFTLFVPNDQAFAKMSTDSLNALLADKQKLTSVLQYHIVQGNLSASDLANTSSVKTLNGASLNISVASGVIHVNDATVVGNPIQTTNGTIYIIDSVLTPPSQ